MKNIKKKALSYYRISLVVFLLCFSAISKAAVVDITAEYKLDPSNQTNIEFKNISPISGYCLDFPHLCPGMFSVEATTMNIWKQFISDEGSIPEHSYTFKIDSNARHVVLRNQSSGEMVQGSLTITHFGTWLESNFQHNMAKFDTNKSTCSIEGDARFSDHWQFYAWKLPESTKECHVPFISGTSVDTEWNYRRTGFAYTLKVDSPLYVPTGIYEGEVRYTVGNGQDIDFYADSYTDDEIIFRITAIVEHSFRLHFPNGSNRIQLEPSGGWGQWLNSGRMPAKMERNVDFSLTTSGPLSIALQCEQEMGTNCALRNQNTGENVELETRVTLPGLKPLGGGAEVKDYRLATGPIKQFFIPEAYSYKRQSTVHFRVNQPHVETMLKQPGSQWAGNVTLIFEAGL